MRIPTCLRYPAAGRLKQGVARPPAISAVVPPSPSLRPGLFARSFTREHRYPYREPRPHSALDSVPRVSANTSEEAVFNGLIECLSIRHPQEEQDEQFCAALWEAYSYLSTPYRKNLPLHIHLALFIAIVPSFVCIQKEFPRPRTRGHSLVRQQMHLHRGLGRLWEQRLRTVALILLEDEAFIAHPDSLSAFELAMGKLAAVGELDGCVAMLREVRARFAGTSDMDTWRSIYDSALRSAVRWLADNSWRRKTLQVDLEPVMEVTQGIVQEMQAAGVEPAESTSLALLDHARWMTGVSENDSICQSYFGILRQILEQGYGIKETSMGWTGLHTGLPDQVKLAVLDYLGRQSLLWSMLAAFEALYKDPVEVLSRRLRVERGAVDRKGGEESIEEKERDLLEKGREAEVAREKEPRAQRALWPQHVAGEPSSPPPTPPDLPSATSSSPRFFSDYLKPLPSPIDVISRSSLSDPISHVRQRAQHIWRDVRTRSNPRPPGYVFKFLLHHVWAARRLKTQHRLVGAHIFRLAVRNAHAEQGLFINRLLHKPMSTVGVSGIALPRAPLDAKWFAAVWQILRWQYGKKRDGREFAPMLRAEVAVAMERLEQERTVFQEVWSRVEEERLGKVGKQEKSVSREDRQRRRETEMETSGAYARAQRPPKRRPYVDLEDHLLSLETTQNNLRSILDWVDYACGATTQMNWRKEHRREMSKQLSDVWDENGGDDDDFGRVQERWYVEELTWYYQMTARERLTSPAFP